MVKFTIPLKRRAALTHEQFVAHHNHVHAALFMPMLSDPEYPERIRPD